jgi:hypothetical protein
MADSPQTLANFTENGFLWVLLAAVGTYVMVHQLPLEGNRPPTTELPQQKWVGLQNVDARLWQDPFGAVAEALVHLQ